MIMSESALSVLQKRYFKPGENWEKLCLRVARALSPHNADVQKEYFRLMYQRDFLPNTPCLINAGTEIGQLMACFVLPVEDSINGIFESVKQAAIIHKSGGGTGFSFSRLREANTRVRSTNGIASGPISFMQVFNAATGAIKQGGVRRGANMGLLRIDHPDIRQFIECKANTKELTNFNISIAITDKFMEAVEKDTLFALESPHDNRVVEEVKARELWDSIAHYAWLNGEPGIIFIDEVNKFNPTPLYGMIEATNPCFSGDMRLLTSRGYVAFKYLRSEEPDIVGADGISRHAKIQKTGVKQCVELVLSDHEKIVCTPEHRLLANGFPVEAKDMLWKRMTPSFVYPNHSKHDVFIAYGFAQGDGNLTRLTSERHSGIDINIGATDADVISKVASFSSLTGSGRKRYWPNVKQEMLNFGFSTKKLPERIFPKAYFINWSRLQQKAFLCGVFSANGSVISNARVSYKTTSIGFAKQLMWALKQHFIESYMTTNKPKLVKFSNGEYVCRESYDVNISKYSSINLFSTQIGFLQDYKTRKLNELLRKRAPKVISINYLKEPIDVYDFSLDEHHWGVVNGFVAHNCGEQPLLPYEACVLGSINLATLDLSGNWQEELRKRVLSATLFLNSVIDASTYPLPEIAEMVGKNRKIGLGVMGWADMLMKLKIPYDSNAALALASEVMIIVYSESCQMSHILATTTGHAVVGKQQLNATTTTIAPTGSISMIADCSSGIEPAFSLAYTKTVIDGTSYQYINQYLKDALEAVDLWTPKIEKEVLKCGSIQNIDEIPQDIKDVFKISHEISPVDHIKMQAAFQEWVDNAVSKTINLPKTATEEDVKEAYMLAYKSKCKGITVYRDGSRESQILSVGYRPKRNSCPECNGKIVHESGCVTCTECGWAVCE